MIVSVPAPVFVIALPVELLSGPLRPSAYRSEKDPEWTRTDGDEDAVRLD